MQRLNENKNNLILLVICVSLILCVCGCSNPRSNLQEAYESGFDDGYNGRKVGGKSKDYLRGYSAGEEKEEDEFYYDLGFSHARNDEEPEYPNEYEYMTGYKDGRR